jgi:predicted enzyme related to lactoylglutathione lyase
MAQVRFNHMELTVAKGELDAQRRADLTAFYGGVLGWETMDVEIVGGTQFLMRPDEGQFILVAEYREPMHSPGYDHLGLLCETRDEVDELLERCRAWQAHDERLRLKTYDDLDTGNLVVHAFYLKFLLPIWFDVQCMEHRDAGPARRWQLVDTSR